MSRILRSLRAALLTLVVLALVLVTPKAFAAHVVPPFTASVVDAAGKLSAGERSFLAGKIERHRRATGFVVAVYLPASLDGDPIEDVAYQTARAWKLGSKDAAGKDQDNGVLFVVAPAERKIRIETGKGVGGALTDLQTNQILHERVGPLLKEDRFREAVEAGVDGIYAALAKDPAAKAVPSKGKKSTGPSGFTVAGIVVLVVVFLVLFAFVSFIARLRRRASRGYDDGYGSHHSPGGGPIIFFGGGSSGGGGDYGGGGGGGGSDDGGSFGGGSSGDYSGGGDFGGGGSSDDY